MKQNTMKHLSRALALFVGAVLFTGCCACRKYQKLTRQPLVGTEWQLIQLDGRSIQPEEGRFTVQFFDDGVVAGVGSCNRITGRYTQEGDRELKVQSLGMTMMMCPSEMETERAMAVALEEADHYDMDGPTLLLLKNGELTAVFQAKGMEACHGKECKRRAVKER